MKKVAIEPIEKLNLWVRLPTASRVWEGEGGEVANRMLLLIGAELMIKFLEVIVNWNTFESFAKKHLYLFG